MSKIPGNTVGSGLFELSPDELVGVQFRGIAGEAVSMKARMLLQEPFDGGSTMHRRAVPQKYHRAAKVTQNVPEKLDHLRGPDILLRMESDQQTESPSLGRDTHGRDGRYLCPAAGGQQDGGLAPTGPGADDIGNQQKTGLIQESQMGSKPSGFFLYGARPRASNSEWPPRFAPGPSVSASDNSSRANPSTSRDSRCSSRSQSASGSLVRCASASRHRWSNQPPKVPVREGVPVSVYVSRTTREVGRGLAWVGAPSSPVGDKSDASGRPNLRKPRLVRRPTGRTGRFSKERWRGGDAAPDLLVSHEVSCPIRYHGLNMVSICY